MNNKINAKILFASIILLIMLSANSFAVDIGLSPSVANFNNMLKSGYAEKKVTLSTSSTENITGHIEVRGPISTWLSFDPTNYSFTFSRNNPLRLTIIAQPPSDAANGVYSGSVSFVTDSVGTLKGTGTLIKAAVQLGVTAEVVGNEIFSCAAGGFRVNDVEFGKPIGIYATVWNQGNVRMTPTITVDVWDRDQKKLLITKRILLTEILPTREADFYREIESNLERGQYWVMISVPDCKQSQLLTFSVVGQGEISDKGRLFEILVDRFVYTDTLMQVRANFVNDGVRSVNAKFIGEVRLGKKLVSALESDSLSVKPGESVYLTTLFTPKQPGKYTVSGRVLYNDKLTFETGTEFEAIGEESIGAGKIIIYTAIYLIILLLIMYLISKIRKERRKRRGHY